MRVPAGDSWVNSDSNRTMIDNTDDQQTEEQRTIAESLDGDVVPVKESKRTIAESIVQGETPDGSGSNGPLDNVGVEENNG